MRQNKYEYDAFISHAVEDKIPIANELCAKLERAGLKIWYSGKELGIGDSIEKTIERGLHRSRYGIVIFSPTYLAKNWTIREFYTLLAKEIEQQKVILPVLYNITLDELKNKDLVMADRFAVNSDKGIDFVVDRLVGEIKKSHAVKRKEAWISKIWLVLIISLLANVALLLKGAVFSGPGHSVLPSVADRGPEMQPYPMNQRTLLGEMQGFFAKMSACSCNDAKERGQPLLYKTRFAQNPADGGPGSEEFLEPEAVSDQNSMYMRGNKVTMAVVFQIETPHRSSPQMDRQVDDLLRTITLEEKQDPFMKVRNMHFPEDNRSHRCADAHTLSD